MKCIKRSWLNTIAAISPNIHDIFTVLRLWYNHSTEEKAMSKNHVEELRKKYIQNPPEGMTPDDIKDKPIPLDEMYKKVMAKYHSSHFP